MSINIFYVVLAAVVAFIVQFLINGPLFGKMRASLENAPLDNNGTISNLPTKLALNLLVNAVTAFGLAAIYRLAILSTTFKGSPMLVGMHIALLVWFAFFVTSTSIDAIWSKKSAKVWVFEACASLIVFIIMGAIVALG